MGTLGGAGSVLEGAQHADGQGEQPSTTQSVNVGQGRRSIGLALPLSGYTHPLLTEVIHDFQTFPRLSSAYTAVITVPLTVP